MRSIGEEEIPESQNFRQRGSTSAQREDGREAIDCSMHAFGREVCGQLWINDTQHLVNKGKTAVHAIHGATADIGRACRGDESVEGGECFNL